MTKVQLRLELARPLEEENMPAVALAHGVYGIIRVRIEPGGQAVVVEYDASHLQPREVESELIRCGLPVKPQAV